MANRIQNFPWAFQEAKVIGRSTATLETGEMDGSHCANEPTFPMPACRQQAQGGGLIARNWEWMN